MAGLQASLQPLTSQHHLPLLQLLEAYREHLHRFEKVAQALSVPGALQLTSSAVEIVCMKVAGVLPGVFAAHATAKTAPFAFPKCADGSPLDRCVFCER